MRGLKRTLLALLLAPPTHLNTYPHTTHHTQNAHGKEGGGVEEGRQKGRREGEGIERETERARGAGRRRREGRERMRWRGTEGRREGGTEGRGEGAIETPLEPFVPRHHCSYSRLVPSTPPNVAGPHNLHEHPCAVHRAQHIPAPPPTQHTPTPPPRGREKRKELTRTPVRRHGAQHPPASRRNRCQTAGPRAVE